MFNTTLHWKDKLYSGVARSSTRIDKSEQTGTNIIIDLYWTP